ncbi:MAG TPA: hypothetical protein VK112_09610 [Fodinibius sp.]|nr:hypothetical protein [Fodinibius sp.]
MLVAAKNSSQNLGDGLSGSVIRLPNKSEIIGIYHSYIPSLKGGFRELVPNGCTALKSHSTFTNNSTEKMEEKLSLQWNGKNTNIEIK